MPLPTVFPAAKALSPFASWRGDHAGIRVLHVDAAIAWYTEKLDFRVMHTMPYGEDAAVQISRSGAALPGSARHHLRPLPSATSPSGGTYLPASARQGNPRLAAGDLRSARWARTSINPSSRKLIPSIRQQLTVPFPNLV